MRKLLKKISVVGLAASVFIGLESLVQVAGQSEFDGEKVTVGIVPGPSEDVWDVVVEKAAADGIEVELVLFNDYIQPNIALADGSIDLNAFQHVAFLENWNEANKEELTPIGFTFVSPMGAYSEKITSLDELEEGDTVAIPNDPTNGGRALLGLEIAGVIEIDDAVGYLPTLDDITDNPKNIQIEELDAAQLALVLPDVAAAFINLNFATDAGLSLTDDAVFVDADHPEQLSEAYRNVIVAQSETVEKPLLLQIVSYYQTVEVAQKLYDTTNNGDKPAWENAPVIGQHRVEASSDTE